MGVSSNLPCSNHRVRRYVCRAVGVIGGLGRRDASSNGIRVFGTVVKRNGGIMFPGSAARLSDIRTRFLCRVSARVPRTCGNTTRGGRLGFRVKTHKTVCGTSTRRLVGLVSFNSSGKRNSGWRLGFVLQ